MKLVLQVYYLMLSLTHTKMSVLAALSFILMPVKCSDMVIEGGGERGCEWLQRSSDVMLIAASMFPHKP